MIIDDYHAGLGIQKLSRKYGIGWRQVTKQLLDSGVIIAAPSASQFGTNDAVSRYRAGDSLANIAKHFGVTTNAIRERLRRAGVKCRDYNIYHYDLTLLMDLSSEVGAYWYGFLLADGHITSIERRKRRYSPTLRCTLSWRDYSHLIKLCRALGTDKSPIMRNRYNKRSLKTYMVAELQINNGELCQYYVNKGWNQFKAGEPILPPELNLRHFLRGVWDGDGCISYQPYRNNKYLVMSYADIGHSIVQWISDMIANIAGVRPKSIRQIKTAKELLEGAMPMFGFRWVGRPAMHVAGVLYSGCTILLDRKRDKLLGLGLVN